MHNKRRKHRRFPFQTAVGRVGLFRARSIAVIGGADGPTKIFVVSRRPKRDSGRLEVRPVLESVLSALRLVSGYLLALTVVLTACNHLLTVIANKHDRL